MTTNIVNISSESESSDDDNDNVSQRPIKVENDINFNQIERNTKNPQNMRENSCINNQSASKPDPLFKIVFRDELTSRKYRRRIEDIIKYVMTTQLDDSSENTSSPDLVLEIYDSINEKNQSSTSCSIATVLSTLPNDNGSNKRKLQDDIEFTNRDKKLKCKHQSDTNFSMDQMNSQSNTNNENQSLENQDLHQLHMNINAVKCEKDAEQINALNEVHKIVSINNCLETSFLMESAQIGSYEYFGKVRSITISDEGLTFFVPTFKPENQIKVICIELDDIVKLLVHFSKTKPALFFFVTDIAAQGIRGSLCMDDCNGPYLDPESKNLVHQRIAIIPEAINDKSENIIKTLFKNKQMIEIDRTAADDLLYVVNAIRNNENINEKNNLSHISNDNQIIRENSKAAIEIFSSDLNTNDSMETILFCHIVKVGSYEYAKKRVFSISKKNVKFCIPLIDESSTITLTIKMDEIEKIAMSSTELLKVLFLYLSSSAAKVIRKTLGMKKNKTPYFNPKMQDNIHDKIIIFPQSVSEDCPVIKKLYKQGKIEKLDEETANDILSKSFQNTKNDNPTSSNIENVPLETKSLRIGCYKCDFMKLNVTISTNGLGLHIPDIKRQNIGFKYIQINLHEIQRVLFHMSEKLNVLFFDINKTTANRIKHLYDLKKSLHFNRAAIGTGAAKKIVIEFMKISTENELALKKLLTHVKQSEEIIPIELAQQMLKYKND